MDTFETLNETCYAAMWGPNEFTCNGVLSGYDGTDSLGSVCGSALMTCGEFDEATLESCGKFSAMIPNARLEVFGEASHMTFVEQQDAYISCVRFFLAA